MNKKIEQYFKNKNCLVTGGTGMIGREVVKKLLDFEANIRIVSLDKIKIDKKIDHVFGDLTNFEFCKNITKDMDCVFHIAGIKGSVKVTLEKPASFFVPLLMFNSNVLEASRINKVKKLVYTSSIGAYSSSEVFKESDEDEHDAPMDMFPGWAKRMAEMQIKAYQIQYNLQEYSVVRPCNVYGPGDNFDPDNAMVIPSLMYRIKSGENPMRIWGDGSAIRDFAFSRDVAEGTIQALYYGTKGKYVNLGSGKATTIKELVETLSSFLDFEYEFDSSKSSGWPKRLMDISLARKIINYNPSTSLEAGLKETWHWFINNQKEHKLKKNYFKE